MIQLPKHGRVFVVGGVSLTQARVGKNWLPTLVELRSTYESQLVQANYFEKSPFTWITLMIRYGLVDSPVPNYMRVSRKSGALDLSIEIDVSQILGASDDIVQKIFSAAIARALNGVRPKYDVPEILDVCAAGET